MLHRDFFIMMSMGGVFVALGIGAIIWDRSEKKGYYSHLYTRTDVREYLEHSPERPGFGALKIGGCIAIGVGLLLIIMGGVLLFWG